jgi:AmiR/NasT family two-component response regulator
MPGILIADDEAIITMQLEERLTAMGYHVAGMVANGESAIEKARTIKPDLVLMDIVMPGKINGIEAAGIINQELCIPVVFVTSYADDTIIEKARNVQPYGYIVKPFNERELKAAIEIALFKWTTERKETQSPRHDKKIDTQTEEYLDLSRLKTLLVHDIFTDLVLFMYTDPLAKEPVYRFILDEGIRRKSRILFAYFSSTLQRNFPKEIQNGQIVTKRLKKNQVLSLIPAIDKCTEFLAENTADGSLQILFDFSDCDDFQDIMAVKNLVLEKKALAFPISGIISADMGMMDQARITAIAENISRIIISNGRNTMLSFAHNSYPANSIFAVSQETVHDVVKKSLGPVVLSLLDRPVSGHDLIHEIHNRYKVLIPQARIYSFLHDLEKDGYLELKMSGKSKLYCPTETGKKYISRCMSDYKTIFSHILGSDTN